MDLWGEAELEPEVQAWYEGLSDADVAIVNRHIDRREVHGSLLGEPYTRQLRGSLRELRFELRGDDWRITYFVATGRRIVLLTVFRKTARRERAQIARAWRAMQRCLAEEHTTRDTDG